MIKLSKENTDKIVSEIQEYFTENLDQEIGNFDAMFLLEFFSDKIGNYFYNQALSDVSTLISKQSDETQERIEELIKFS
jgi:uncharacterized protein (DUF2164 family)